MLIIFIYTYYDCYNIVCRVDNILWNKSDRTLTGCLDVCYFYKDLEPGLSHKPEYFLPKHRRFGNFDMINLPETSATVAPICVSD